MATIRVESTAARAIQSEGCMEASSHPVARDGWTPSPAANSRLLAPGARVIVRAASPCAPVGVAGAAAGCYDLTGKDL